MSSVKTVTRLELIHEGATTFEVRLLTHNLEPLTVEDKTNIYKLNDVIASIRLYLNHTYTQPETRESLEDLLGRLIKRLDNVVHAPFGKSVDEQIGFHIDRILGKNPDDE